MKPHRVRMAHDLISAYGMLDKMTVLVRIATYLLCYKNSWLQRPRRCSPEGMTAFHTDEYVDFLYKVTPETVEELTASGRRCMWYWTCFMSVSH